MSIPRHQQLASELLEQIADGSLAVGDRLPTEDQLCESHGLARGTVRRALGRLEQLGVIERRRGSGTTVIATAPVASYQPFAHSPADIAELAAESRIVGPETADIVADAALAYRLGAQVGSRWFVLRGPRAWRTRPDAPFCWSEHYLRSGTPNQSLLHDPFKIENVTNKGVIQTISAALLDGDIARALGATAGAAALVIIRRHSDARGRIASVGIHIHPADRYEITTTL
ncbi:GntR family transcriptional regulator [Frankia gtarii]|uniref:GntR family transcriptional regulator n=1 Tax=Frankia gtarii TaxID=2950102 RepID=UPI0021BE78E0|nr:GntR family transcriptional regulator [Frankia gtarii]